MTIRKNHFHILFILFAVFLISPPAPAATSLSMEEMQYINKKMYAAPVENKPQNEKARIPAPIYPYQQHVMPPDNFSQPNNEIKRFRYEITASLGYAVGSDALTENYGPAFGAGSLFLYHKETSDGRTVTAGLFLNGLGAKDRDSQVTLRPGEGVNNTSEVMELKADSVFLQAGLSIMPLQYTFQRTAIRFGWRTGYTYFKTTREYRNSNDWTPVSDYTRRSRGIFIGQHFDIGINEVENGKPVGLFLRFGLDAVKVWDVEVPNADVPHASRGAYGWSFWPTISLGGFLTTRGRRKQ